MRPKTPTCLCRLQTRWRRPFSSLTSKVKDSKAFTKTLLLPKTTFPLRADLPKSEVAFRTRTCEALYQWQWKNAKGPLFVLHDGPPYANGDLHMGHALNKILKDIVNRFHVSCGRKVHFIPGWDCHGLPIENKALQELGKDPLALPASVIRSAANSTAIREVASQKEQFRQLGIMADWNEGSTYRSLDQKYEIRQLRIFQKMVENNLIHRHHRPVHYSPSSHSALAEAELIYKHDHVSHSAYVFFEIDAKANGMPDAIRKFLPLESTAHLLVWTTTPWTLTANMGIAVHPKLMYSVVRTIGENNHKVMVVARNRLEALTDVLGPIKEITTIRGSELVNASYLPIFSSLCSDSRRLKVIPASYVTSDSGTGLVHCAPAHGVEDYNAFQSLGLLSSSTANMLCHVDKEGKFTSSIANVVGDRAKEALIGQEVLKGGSKAIVELLHSIGCLAKIEKIKHPYPYDWKTNEPIIVMATSQWFANLSDIKDRGLKALRNVAFFPPATRNRLETFIRSRSEWCISRQRVWGVPIPALHHIPTDRAILDPPTLHYILSILEERGVAHWWDGQVEDFVPPALRNEGVPVHEVWRKGTDTMDVWFDSGTSWSMLDDTRAAQEDSGGGRRRLIADVCIEGSDQHRGWFQSQLLTAVGSAARDEVPSSPYRALITHGMVLDEVGKKMSKSIGNVMNPMTVVNGGKNKTLEPAYGADVLRLWAATVEYWRDTSIGPTVLTQAAESLRKIRNSARFILGNIGESQHQLGKLSREDLGLGERYVMHELYKLENVALEGYRSYNFSRVISSLTHFTNITLSSLYFDITKDCLYADGQHSPKRLAVVAVLKQILTTMTSILAPVLPHLAEEIHDTLRGTGPDKDENSFFTRTWTQLGSEWEDPQAEHDMNDLLWMRTTVLSLLEKARRQKQLGSSLEAEVDLLLTDDSSDVPFRRLLQREENFLKTLFIVSDVHLVNESGLVTPTPPWTHVDHVSTPGCGVRSILVRPATREKCPRCWTFTRSEEKVLCDRCTSVVDSPM